MTTLNERRTERHGLRSWGSGRWLLLTALAIAIVVAVVLILLYTGGGGGGGGGRY